MAYFLPSYFQKRLLRYALSRLDFIESDGLDLENFGLSFGQRSVIELKNVGIKVKRLVDTLQLPSSCTLSQASIRLLRLTIPADLHVSGIEVEVEGVDIVAGVRLEKPSGDHTAAGAQPGCAPSRTDRANRPRISSPPVHDPGGRHGWPLDASQVLPTSEDLAASFLDSEPAGERQELRAVLESQYMQESIVSSVSAEEAGLGMPGGLSLPSFVANFFQGVGDRLSVHVQNVSVVIEIEMAASSGSAIDSPRFMLNVSKLDLEGVPTPTDAETIFDARRSVFLHQVQLFALSDPDVFPASSRPSSPKLSRSKRPSSDQDHGFSDPARESVSGGASMDDDLPSSDVGSDVTSQGSGTSSTVQRLSSSNSASRGLGIGIDSTILDGPALFSSPRIATPSVPSGISSSFRPRPAGIDNRARAEHITMVAHESHVTPHISPGDREDLSRSRTFTHDEAESMYLSAMTSEFHDSRARGGIPDAWEWSDAVEEQEQTSEMADSVSVPEPSAQAPGVPNPESPGMTNVSGETDDARGSAPSTIQAAIDSLGKENVSAAALCRLRLLHLDHASLKLPCREDNTRLPAIHDHSTAYHRQDLDSDRSPSSLGTNTADRNAFSETRDTKVASSDGGKKTMTLDIGTLTLDLDISVGKLLARVAQGFVDSLPEKSAPATSTQVNDRGNIPELIVNKFVFNFCESVPKLLPTKLGAQQSVVSDTFVTPDQALLQLSLSPIKLTTLVGADVRYQLSISKITLKHAATEVLSFVDMVSVRESIATSAMLRPHDLVATKAGNRLDIQVKPVHIMLNLLLLDDVLSRSGGLSSLLDLRTSIISTNTARGASSPPVATTTPPRQRTVRFNDPRNRPRAQSDAFTTSSKINVRLSGSVIDLVGSESSIQVKSSAIKAVYREDNVKIQIDGAAVEGPLLPSSPSRGDIHVKIRDIQLHYSNSPEETDLDRLLCLITPSSDRYDEDDDIMIETLLRQRRKGGVLRLSIGDLQAGASGLLWIPHLAKLSDELAKLSSVTKYLPEDDRPGILTFAMVNKLDGRFHVDDRFGALHLKADLMEGAHINVPSLAAAQITTWTLTRDDHDVLVGEVISQSDTVMSPPMFMCRFIADEMDPTVRLKLSNTCLEYRVSTLVALTDLADRLQHKEAVDTEKASSHQLSPISSSTSSEASAFARRIRLSLVLRDSAIALNPEQVPARGLLLLTDAVIGHSNQKHGSIENVDIKKASILIINDTVAVGSHLGNADQKLYFDQNDQVQQLTKAGFVPVGSISSASALVKVMEEKATPDRRLDVELRNNLLFLETCADSTQTLIQILGGLAPPAPPSKVAKYRTEIVPIQDMLASFTGNAFVSEPGPELGLPAFHTTTAGQYEEDEEDGDGGGGRHSGHDDEFFIHHLQLEHDDADDEMTASYAGSELAQSTMSASVHIAPVDVTASDGADLSQSIMAHSLLDFRNDHFIPKSSVGGTAHRWDSSRNTYELGSDSLFERSPLTVRVRDVHIIWNLFDGYDWQATRDTISEAVKDLETRAMAKRPRSGSRLSPGVDEDDESVIGDFLFNSIYIGIPANKDPRDLTNAINHDIDDMVSETGSYATGTTVTPTSTRRQSGGPRLRPKRLRLNRSQQHKMTFELEGVSADVVVFPPGSGEVESSVDVRVKKLEIFDHVPTSTWKKFATYMQDAGEREVDTPMVHIELLSVKPVADLATSEMVLKLTVLPLRLHVDQDALDFMSRFFEFKDDKAPVPQTPSNPPFLQRVEVNPIQVRLDFKPKRVDYAGLRSGRTTEFMNFFVLDRADMVLRRVILYGVSGFDRLGIMLNNIWTPDVKRNQLPGVLAGLAPIRPLVDVSSGVRDLIAVPIREYRKDGRIVRSIQKGALAFAKTTTTELVNLGAKLAIGTQQVLQTAEELLAPGTQQDDGDTDDETRKHISLYADQPLGIVQGLRTAYASLERDLLLARDAIVAVPGEVMASGSATGAARAVLKQSPTIILRPAIGATKAVGQTLMGAGNTLDRQNLRRIEEVSNSPVWNVVDQDPDKLCRSIRDIKRHQYGPPLGCCYSFHTVVNFLYASEHANCWRMGNASKMAVADSD